MDLTPPARIHDPGAVSRALAGTPSPFARLFRDVLDPILANHRPRRVAVSLAYLSQLAGAVDLVRFLADRSISPRVGGSLIRSLHLTGNGLAPLRSVLARLDTSDGGSLLDATHPEPLLDRLAWPTLLGDAPYLSSRPIIPLTLSTGCHWRRCLFCPDRVLPHHAVPLAALAGFLSTVPAGVMARRPVIHLLDSAMPPTLLRDFLPLVRAHGLGFYGFARPTRALYENELLCEAARSGCLMLQLGVESGSRALLDRFDKGIDPAEAEQCVREAAAAGIRTYLYLLFGLPGETDAHRQATLDLVARCGRAVDFLNLSLFNLPRHCELTRRAAEFGITVEDFPGDDPGLRLYHPFRVGRASPRDEARAFLKRRFHPHPAVHDARLRTPRWLRAAHLALMSVPGRVPPAPVRDPGRSTRRRPDPRRPDW